MELRKGKLKQSSFLKVLNFSFSVLSKQEKRRYIFLVILQAFLNFLEFFALLLVIALIGLSSEQIGNIQTSNILQNFLPWFGLDGRSTDEQLFLIGTATVSIFITKTIASIVLNKKTLKFLSDISASISTKTLGTFISQNERVDKLINSSELIFSLSSAVRKIFFLILGTFPVFIADLSLLFFLCLVLVLFDPTITFVALFIFSVAFGISHLIVSRKTYALGNQATSNDLIANSLILNMLRNRKEIFVRGSTQSLLQLYTKARSRHFVADGELIFLQNSSRYIFEIVIPLGAFILIVIQVFFFRSTQGALSLGVFLVAGTRLAPAIVKIQSNLLVMKTVAGEVKEIIEVFNKLHEKKEPSESLDLQFTSTLNQLPLSLKNVSFRYAEQDNFELKSVNLEVNPGEIVAIMGPSGSGKSTLIDLALGLIEPDSGEIRLAGKKPRDAIMGSPGKIAYLPQEIMIIGGSVRDNILFGADPHEFDDSLVWDVLARTNLDSYVKSLQHGLDTQIGEFGVAISGGQKQRLNLARALITNPIMMIFDEVTSALDLESENFVKEMLLDFKNEKTVILVSHSKNLVEIASRVVILEKGEITSRLNY